jgi:hypothetical protein
MLVDLPVFVGSSQKNYVLGIFELEGKEEQQSFNTLVATVDIVPQE